MTSIFAHSAEEGEQQDGGTQDGADAYGDANANGAANANGDANPPLADLRNVSRRVVLPDDEQLHILRGVDLQVRVGHHTAIVGRSGCGQSTLLNILDLLDVPSSGQMLFDGSPVERLRNNTRARLRGASIGFVLQQFNLLPGRTALENVVTPLM